MRLFDYQRGLEQLWEETDGFTALARGTASGPNVYRHQACFAARDRQGEWWALVNHFEDWIELSGRRYPLSSTFYYDETEAEKLTLYPRGYQYLVDFSARPFISWTFQVEGHRVVKTIRPSRGERGLFLQYAINAVNGSQPIIFARPMLSGRKFHDLHLENAELDQRIHRESDGFRLRTYAAAPAIHFAFAAPTDFSEQPAWYRRVRLIASETDEEAYFSPGEFMIPLAPDRESWIRLSEEATPRPAGLVEPRTFVEEERLPVEAVTSFRRMIRLQTPAESRSPEAAPAGEPGEAAADHEADTLLSLALLADFLDGDLLAGFLRRYAEETIAAPLDAQLAWVIAVADSLRRGLNPAAAAVDAALSILDALCHRRSSKGLVADQALLRAASPDMSWWGRRGMKDRLPFTIDLQALWLNALSAGEIIAEATDRPAVRAQFTPLLLTASDAVQRHFWWPEEHYLRDSVDLKLPAGATTRDALPPRSAVFSSAALFAPAFRHSLLPPSRSRAVLNRAAERLAVHLPGEGEDARRHCLGLRAAVDDDWAYPWLLALWWRGFNRCRDATLPPLSLAAFPAFFATDMDFSLPLAIRPLPPTGTAPATIELSEENEMSLLSLAGYLAACRAETAGE